jgi:GNAT superfamily N-acetyltransferase
MSRPDTPLRAQAALLETVGPGNLAACGIGCVTNPNHPGCVAKVDWLRDRFAEGLRFLLFRDGNGTPLAFLEYVPGEYAWRPVHADGWLFVHCLWVYPRGQKIGGLGSRLIEACVDAARRSGAAGVAAMVSDEPWIAGKEIFLENGFRQVAEVGRFQLVVRRLRAGPAPRFRDISGSLAKYRGLHIVYADQCPMLVKSVADVKDVAAEHGLDLKVTLLENARQAQRAPSHYGVYSLVWNGRLLSDHYVSKARFRNLLRKEILPERQVRRRG